MSDATRLLIFHPRAEVFRDHIVGAGARADIRAITQEAELADAIADAEVLVTLQCPPAVVDRARALRWIQTTSAGVDPLLVHREALRGITVTNARGIHGDQMADYAMAGMTMMLWDFPRMLRDQAARIWRREAKKSLSGCVLGIVGLGHIGRTIARRAVASGMDVVGVSSGGRPVDGVGTVWTPDGLHDMLPRCDFVVLVVPATGATERLIDERALRLMRPSAFLLNFSRGSVVDEPALIRALEDGTVAGAVLDVFAHEPLPRDSRLWSMPNVIVTPHLAGLGEGYEAKFAATFAANLQRFQRGEPVHDRVDLTRGY